MAAGKWKVYEKAKLNIESGLFSLSGGDVLKMTLHSSASNANTLSGSEVFADITNELATANGYTAGGKTLTPTLTNAAGVITFDCDDQVWTASGGSIAARFAVIRVSGTKGGKVDPIVAVCLLDTTPADVTATAGNTLTVQINASGCFQLSGAATD